MTQPIEFTTLSDTLSAGYFKGVKIDPKSELLFGNFKEQDKSKQILNEENKE